MINIVHILPWLSGGGVEQRRYLLAQHLDPDRYKQFVIYMEDVTGWVPMFEAAGAEMIHIPGSRSWSPFDFQAIQETATLLHQIQPNLVHGAVFEGVSMASIAGRIAGIPNIIIEETGNPSLRGAGGNLLMGLYSTLATACVGVSKPIADYFTQKLYTPSRKVFCIDNGVRAMSPLTEVRRQKLRYQWGISDDDIVIGSVGRIHDAHKRFSDLIEIISTLRAQDTPVKLVLVGDGPDLKNLKDLANSLDLSAHVIFPGFQRDIEDFFGMMDIFALLSVQESFGLVVAEAMMCELPTVVTAVGGMKLITVPGVTGFQVPVDRPEAAAKPLRRLLENPSCREEMGKAGRRRALAKYSQEAYIQRVDNLYHGLLKVQ